MPSTIRVELDKLGFDWKQGIIVHEEGTGRQSSTGRQRRTVGSSDTVLDRRFSNGANLADVPRVFARDPKAVYFPAISAIAGARLMRVSINPETYLKQGEAMPYPGDE